MWYTMTFILCDVFIRLMIMESISSLACMGANGILWSMPYCLLFLGWRGGQVDWSLAIQRCGHGFESQWQWVRSVIITEAVFRSFLITPPWFPRRIPVPSNKKTVAEVKFEICYIVRGPTISPHLLSLHNRAGVAGSRSVLTSHRLKYKALVKIRHLFIYYLAYKIMCTIIYDGNGNRRKFC